MITEVESRDSRQVPHSEVRQKAYESAENDDWSLVTNNALPSHVLTAERDNKHLLFLAAAKAHVTAFEVIFAAVEKEDGAEKVISDLNDRGRTLAMCIYRGGSKPILETFSIQSSPLVWGQSVLPYCLVDASRHARSSSSPLLRYL
ncbi:hypothetical protein PROFUN_14762 [Planoprotostelium fungivorum]|uniref:Uncharacterized protein n=1 Tax=Planoprotostelium fungivorum TaxID=1890364 RepID=A0A2P6MYP8_9EUKA|nr:hypothetical protein PROFUN_14762 [Planoprotostelium fungivorum]